MSEISEMLDIGGTPTQNAACALIMLASAAAHPDERYQAPDGYVDLRMDMILANAGAIATGAIDKAKVNGFAHAPEFDLLIAAGRLTRRLESLALEAILLTGGPNEFFDLVRLVAAPPPTAGGLQ